MSKTVFKAKKCNRKDCVICLIIKEREATARAYGARGR